MTRVHAGTAIAAALLWAGPGCQNQVQTPGGEGPEGAALNVGLGAAVAPLHRAATGCYTPCAYGTSCDEASGTCVSRECTAGEPGCTAPASGAVMPGPGAPATPAEATPVCTPACLGEEQCVLESGRPSCRKPGAAPPFPEQRAPGQGPAPRGPDQGAKPAR